MKILSLLAALLLFMSAAASAQDQYGCQPKALEIREKAEDGSTLQLEFGSLWAIERAERAETRLWLRLERVHVCKGGLRKENSQRVVKAMRIQ